MSPPEIDAVLAGARRAGARTRNEDLGDDGTIPNVVVAMDDPEPAVELTDDGYVGGDAAAFGLLAVAAGFLSAGHQSPAGSADAVGMAEIALHYPEADFTARGPWLVLEPLSGFLSTVHTGTGRVTVELEYDRASDHHLETVSKYVDQLLAAARPGHEQYPVEADEDGVFRTGMTTFTPDRITTNEETVTARFDVSTTPATTGAGIAATFGAIDGVVNVRYDAGIGVEHADPGHALRSAAEAAHLSVLGDAGYEWYPEPTVFSRIPSGEKVAFGTGVYGSDEFTNESYATCVELLRATVANLGGDE